MVMTRSQTKRYDTVVCQTEIDFLGASQAWRRNKQYLGNGCFKYLDGPSQSPLGRRGPLDRPAPVHRYPLRSRQIS